MLIKVFEFSVELILLNKKSKKLNNNILLTTIKTLTNAEIPLYLNDFIENQISLIAPVKSYESINTSEYKYFNPKIRNFFFSIFNKYYLAKDLNEIERGLSEIYN